MANLHHTFQDEADLESMPNKADAAVASSILSSETELSLMVLTSDPLDPCSILKHLMEVLQRADTGWSDVLRQTFTNIIAVK